MKNCKLCDKLFEPLYKHKRGDFYTNKSVVFCSKSCAGKFNKPVHTKESLTDMIVLEVQKEGAYIAYSNLVERLKISNKTFRKYGISVFEIQNTIGLFKPKSTFEKSIHNILLFDYPDTIVQYTDKNLKSPKNYQLFIDFYIPSLGAFIEVDGTQHLDVEHMWYSDYSKTCDEIKNKFARDNDIKMIRIPYKRRVTKTYVNNFMQSLINYNAI